MRVFLYLCGVYLSARLCVLISLFIGTVVSIQSVISPEVCFGAYVFIFWVAVCLFVVRAYVPLSVLVCLRRYVFCVTFLSSVSCVCVVQPVF